MKRADLVGQKYGRLTVMAFDHIGNNHKSYWKCLCDCGNQKVVAIDNLKRPNQSCGCYNRERIAKLNKKHGDCDNPLYAVLRTMKARCYRPTSEKYRLYGARGIKICDTWLNNYTAFREWALSHGYKKGLSIDRINPNGNYEPSNCRWATITEQNRNRRPFHRHPKTVISLESGDK